MLFPVHTNGVENMAVIALIAANIQIVCTSHAMAALAAILSVCSCCQTVCWCELYAIKGIDACTILAGSTLAELHSLPAQAAMLCFWHRSLRFGSTVCEEDCRR